MTKLFLAWQDPESRAWYPVGRLTSEGGRYLFVYTQGALASSRFPRLGNMQDLGKQYESLDLLPLFSNRVLPKSRPEYQQLLHWLNLKGNEADPLQLLGLTEGIRRTDNFTVFPCPTEQKDGTCDIHFFSHGIRYLPKESVARIDSLTPGARLFVMPDVQNKHDKYAIVLRTDDPPWIVGYCPRYFAREFGQLLAPPDPVDVEVTVDRINRDAPIQLRMLCRLTGPWPEEFRPCEGGDYTPLA